MEGYAVLSEHNSNQILASKSLVVSEDEIHHSTQEPQKPWKPWTLNSVTLVSIAIFTGGLAVLLGILQWQNARYGALFFAPTVDGFSFAENFLYRYLPTIIIVLYGLAWSWIDLDIKRLEPWFQLAHAEGASAEESLLLQYPVDFLPLVPFKAAKLRQWPVVIVSTIMVVVSWCVIPLQNGIFNNGAVVVSTITSLLTTNSFLPVGDQSAKLGGNILNTAYSIVWLGQEMLPFTTSKYALAPFDAIQPGNTLTSNQTLTAATILYGTDISCRPPSDVTFGRSDITFDDGQGCVAQDLLPISDGDLHKRFAAYYIGYYDDANVDADLQLAGCPISSSHEFLVIWKLASMRPPDFRNVSDATALFCTPNYYSQPVNATITITNQKVLSVQPLGPRTQLTDKEFNITHFEYLLANGIPAAQPTAPQNDISEVTNIHQDSRLRNMSLVSPTANMIGFAIGSTHLEPEAYLSPSNLQMAIQRAHRLLFSVAVQAVLKPARHNPSATGYVVTQLQGISLVPIFAYLSEGFLILIVIFTVHLVYATSSRPSALFRDPDSLAQVMSLSRHPDLQHEFIHLDSADGPAISKALRSLHFDMNVSQGETPPMIRRSSIVKQEIPSHTSRKFGDGVSQQDFVSIQPFIGPLEYNRIIVFLFSASLAGIITVLIFLHKRIHSEDGLPMPSQNPVAQQVILNLLPTAAATMMEPVWVLLTRVACMMRPLEELKSGYVQARRSLTLKYTAIPPQLLSWRALRVGHVFLAALGVVTILANLLTVALSGLFTQADILRPQQRQLAEIYQHSLPPDFGTLNETDSILSPYTQNDPFYVAMANFSGVSSLPPWTSANYGFFPLELEAGLSDDSSYFELQATGYGLDLDCQELTETPSDATYNLTFSPYASVAKFVVSYKQSNGSEILCIPSNAILDSKSTLGGEGFMAIEGDPAGFKAFEYAGPMTTFENIYDNPDFVLSAPENAILDDSPFCNSLIVRGWVRANTTVRQAAVGSATNSSASSSAQPDTSTMTLSKTFISCQPRLKSAVFDLRVSTSGAIMMATQNSTVSYVQMTGNSSLSATLNQTTAAFAVVNPAWHNNTFANDWFNDLAKVFTNSTALLDVNVPPPNFSVASNLTRELYSRVFAIQMSLLTPQLLPAAADTKPIPVRQMTLERRVFMSEPLFYISIMILALDLMMAVIFYWRVPAPFLPRIPVNIANQIAFFSGSHVIDDVQNAGGDLRELDRRGYRYGYGRYVGKDGRVHLGIEREPYVTPVDRAHGGLGLWSSLRKRR